MECIEARGLIGQGVFSGTPAALDGDLWQHLTHCEGCRAHYEAQRVLFRELLPQEDIPTLPPFAPQQPSHPTPDEPGWRGAVSLVAAEASPHHAPSTAAPMPLARWLWILAIALLVGGPAVGGTWFALVLFRAHQNVSAMIVPTASQQPTATSAVASAATSPTSLLISSPATLPTASPTPCPTAPPTATPPIKLSLSPPPSPPPAPSSTQATPALPAESSAPLMPPLAVASPQSSRQYPTSWPTIQSLPPVRPASWPTIPVAPDTSPESTPLPPGVTHVAALPTPVQRLASARSEPGGAGDEAMTLLFLGNDRRPGERGIPRTDTILLVRADPYRNRIALLSLPRDLWVNIPGYGSNRINAAYVWGEIYHAQGGGLGLARRTVSGLLGIEIDDVTMVDFEGFIGLIDTLGGITVDVEKELYDPTFPTMDYGYQAVHFVPGPQQMDGRTALTYSRIRHPDSDFMRNRRQQAVLVAIGQRLRERGDMQNLATIDRLTGALKGFVQTTIPEARMAHLLWTFRNFDPARVERYSITNDMVAWGVGADRYALVAPRPVLNSLVAQFMGEGMRSETLP